MKRAMGVSRAFIGVTFFEIGIPIPKGLHGVRFPTFIDRTKFGGSATAAAIKALAAPRRLKNGVFMTKVENAFNAGPKCSGDGCVR